MKNSLVGQSCPTLFVEFFGIVVSLFDVLVQLKVLDV
jgi:hypothetical protein